MATLRVLEDVEENPLYPDALRIEIDCQLWVVLDLPSVINAIYNVSSAFLCEQINKSSVHVVVFLDSASQSVSHAFRDIAVGLIANKDHYLMRLHALDGSCEASDLIVLQTICVVAIGGFGLDAIYHNPAILYELPLLICEFVSPLGPEAPVDLEGHPVNVFKV